MHIILKGGRVLMTDHPVTSPFQLEDLKESTAGFFLPQVLIFPSACIAL